jgi:hypothetical protein
MPNPLRRASQPISGGLRHRGLVGSSNPTCRDLTPNPTRRQYLFVAGLRAAIPQGGVVSKDSLLRHASQPNAAQLGALRSLVLARTEHHLTPGNKGENAAGGTKSVQI